VSHEAWIHKGIIKAITGSEYVKEANVNKILRGTPVNWKIKNDKGDYDYQSDLLSLDKDKEQYVNNNKQIYYSAFTPHLKGVATRSSRIVDSNRNMITVRFINFDIMSLYLYTQTGNTGFPLSHILIESKAPQKFRFRNTGEYHDVWDEDNTFCYEAKFNINTSKESIKKKARNDLDFYLMVNGRVETRKTNCLLLVKDSTVTNTSAKKDRRLPFKSKNVSEQFRFLSANDIVASLNNNDLFFSTPLFNGINDSLRNRVVLTANSLLDLQVLKKELKNQGLLLSPTTREVDMLVITDNNTNN